jgi:hypothetical protein
MTDEQPEIGEAIMNGDTITDAETGEILAGPPTEATLPEPPPYLAPVDRHPDVVFAEIEPDDDDPAAWGETAYQPWVPPDIDQAEWAMATLRSLSADLEEIDVQYETWRNQLDEWKADAVRGTHRRAEHLRASLIAYAERWRAQDPTRRTLILPSGRVSATVPKKGRLQITDHAALIAWLHNDTRADVIDPEQVIKHIEDEVLVSKVAEYVEPWRDKDGRWVAIDKGTGEVVPGMAVIPPGDPTYNVKPG